MFEEKPKSIKARNLNSHLRYLIPTVKQNECKYISLTIDEVHERLRGFKSYCFVGFVYISALGLSVFKVQCEFVGREGLKKKKK